VKTNLWSIPICFILQLFVWSIKLTFCPTFLSTLKKRKNTFSE